MLEKTLNWLIFSLFLASFPIILPTVLLYFRTQTIDFATIGRHGEIYIMVTSLIAPLLAEWVGLEIKTKLYRIFRLCLVGAFLYLLLFSVAFYTDLIINTSPLVAHQVFDNSIRMLIASVIVIISNIVLCERVKKLEGTPNG